MVWDTTWGCFKSGSGHQLVNPAMPVYEFAPYFTFFTFAE